MTPNLTGEPGLGMTVPELRKALELECQVSAELRAELHKAKEEIHALKEALRLSCLSESTQTDVKAEPCNGHNASAESEKDSLIQSGDQDEPSETAETAAKGSYVKAEGKVYWVSYEDPEQLIRLPANALPQSSETARMGALEARTEAEPRRRLSGHERLLPGTPEDQVSRPMRPTSLDPHRTFAYAGCPQGQPFCVQPAMPMSARCTIPARMPQRPAVSQFHGLSRQGSGHFPPHHQLSTGSLSSVRSMQRLPQVGSCSDLHARAGPVHSQFAGRFQLVPQQLSWTPRKEVMHQQPQYCVHGRRMPPPANVATNVPCVAPKTRRNPQDELMNLQSHLKRLQGLQAQLEQQLSDVQ